MINLEYLKWTATVLLIVGFTGVSAGFYNFIFIQFAGGLCWLSAAIILKDKPLIATNGVMTVFGIAGLFYNYLFN